MTWSSKMVNLTTKYLGLTLKNPIVAGSCGLTNSIDDLKALEAKGVGAIVLKSIFEEEIIAEMKKTAAEIARPQTMYPEIYDFFDMDTMEDTVTKYIGLIEEAKKTLSIPIIASVNCVSADDWTVFAQRVEEAGADALELNLFILPSDFNRSGEDNEKVYFDVVEKIKASTKLPISLKISYYFSNLAQTIKKLSETGIAGLTLFNRFFSPNIDIDAMKVVPSSLYSLPSDISISLRWVGIMSNRVSCDIAASTGVHDGDGVIKQLLAGANVVHIASVLYKNGFDAIPDMLASIEKWMTTKGFDSVDEFRGKLSQEKSSDPAAYERAQFMKHFAGKLSAKI
jgi:dihydroorotate dehydrogenase (fumarate)